jgi:rSAM/selenodomain-associated transferase 2
MKLSIIIPVLNEARRIPQLLEELKKLEHSNCEIIFVDGGSEDASVKIAEHAGFKVEKTTRGRARQMNTGAKRATGSVLLFLHADTQLPDNSDLLVKRIFSDNPSSCWGYFRVRIDGYSKILHMVGFMMNLRSYLTNIVTGDQVIFVKKKDFLEIDGFPEQLLMEDIELSKKLRTLSRPSCINYHVITSGRRWELHGVWHTIFLMWRLRWDYWRGIPANQLAGKYK